jgi:hypothetical protein
MNSDVKTSQLNPNSDALATGELSEAIARYLDGEREYHADVLDLIRQLASGRLRPEDQTRIDEFHSRRHALLIERSDLLAIEARQNGSTAALSELVRLLPADRQRPLLAGIQSVRSLVIHTRLAAERLDRRLTMMHECLDEILTGQPPIRSSSYDRSGKLKSRPSNRSLLTRRG